MKKNMDGEERTAFCMQEMLVLRKMHGVGLVKDGKHAGTVFSATDNPRELGALVAELHGSLLAGFYKAEMDEAIVDYFEGYLSDLTPLKGRALRNEAEKYYQELCERWG